MTAASHPPSSATTGWRHVRDRLRTVCTDGLADERGAGRRSIADEISQPVVPRRSWLLPETAGANGLRADHRLCRAGVRRSRFRQARDVTLWACGNIA